jgi:hypothetical protein
MYFFVSDFSWQKYLAISQNNFFSDLYFGLKIYHLYESASCPLSRHTVLVFAKLLMNIIILIWEWGLQISGLYYKSFIIVIYDHNDSTIVEPLL